MRVLLIEQPHSHWVTKICKFVSPQYKLYASGLLIAYMAYLASLVTQNVSTLVFWDMKASKCTDYIVNTHVPPNMSTCSAQSYIYITQKIDNAKENSSTVQIRCTRSSPSHMCRYCIILAIISVFPYCVL